MKKFLGLFGVLGIAALAPLAHADFALSINGVTCATGPGNPAALGGESGACAFTAVAGATVTNFSTVGLQLPTGSQQLSSTLSIAAGAGGATVTLGSAVNDFTKPTTPPSVLDTFTFTLNGTQGTTMGVFKACVDTGNGLTSPTGTCGPTQTLTVIGNQSDSSPTGSITLASLAAPFGLNEQLVLTLGANAILNITETQTLTQVPEPGSIVLLGGALVGLATLFRRKLARQA